MFFNEPLPSNDRRIFSESLPSSYTGTHIQTTRLIGGTYERVEMGSVSMTYIHIKFNKDRFWHSDVYKGDNRDIEEMVIA
jgi:hypothetical protein